MTVLTVRNVTRVAISLVCAIGLLAAGFPEPAFTKDADGEAQADWDLPEPSDVDGVDVSEIPVGELPEFEAADAVVNQRPDVSWPEPVREQVSIARDSIEKAGKTTEIGAPQTGREGRKPVGKSPVSVGASPAAKDLKADNAGEHVPSHVDVELATRDRARQMGVNGLVVGVERADEVRADGEVAVEIDYSGFRHAYGGDWASRLQVSMLSGCELSGGDDACDVEPLPTDNDTRAGVLAATVPLSESGGPTLLAVSASSSGDNGDYTATSLSPAGTWQVSQQNGAFSWSYPLNAVPGVGGPEPDLGLGYSSQSVDGRTANTNSQGSWIGDGWDMWPGYIERSYVSCKDDQKAINQHDPNNKELDTGDLCWRSDNATMSFNGQAMELVRGSDGLWHGADDQAYRIEKIKDTSLGNGDADGEYWRLTTTDGTQYFFGKHRRSSNADDMARTQSTWTAPVYGNHPGEPCYDDSYADSRCTQAWRWNLDYVVDPSGNTMTLFYQRETGAYGREADADLRTTYHRGGYLTKIEYGTRKGTEHSATVPARMVFDTADRCLPGESCTVSNPTAWPDVPWDQYCSAEPCTDQLSPTFFTQKRLAKLRTQVWRGSGFSNVESWTLRHDYLDAGASEGEGVPMWLAGVTHTGHVTQAGGSAISEPEVTFDPGSLPLANRVNGGKVGRTDLNRWRLKRVWTESGAIINVTYSNAECDRDALPKPHTNGQRCYPQYYGPGSQDDTLDWFHKYVVDKVTVEDVTGASPRMETHYDYLDDPAWAYNKSDLIPSDKWTWAEWRGFSKVRVRQGLESEQQSATEYLYMRGMDGDRLNMDGGKKSVSIIDSQGDSTVDHEAHAGYLREQITYDGVGGQWVSGAINTPWRHGPTAVSPSVVTLKSWMTNTKTVRERTRLEDGSTRWKKTLTDFDLTYGMATKIDSLGDTSTAYDDTCTRFEYARNTDSWMVDRVNQIETVAVECGTPASRPDDVISLGRTFFDDPDAFGATPTRGLPVKTQELDSWNGASPVWATSERQEYDVYGRMVAAFDALDRETTTAYTPATGGPVTAVTTTNALGHTSTESYEPGMGIPIRVDDANGRTTDLTYDGLGRLTAAWLPGRDQSSESANMKFSYLLLNDAPSAVTTQSLRPTGGDAYVTSISLFDGSLRERQTQTDAPGGGRVITEQMYDSRGLAEWEAAPYYDTSNNPPSTTLLGGEQPQIPGIVEYSYDGAGRQVTEVFLSRGSEEWRSTTAYGGDRVHVTPPDGGTATTTIEDVFGRTTALRQYKSGSPSGAYDETTYSYNKRGEQELVTDPAGDAWSFEYDVRGRKVQTDDPDLGTTRTTYDAAGQVLTTTDGNGSKLGYTYDDLGRKTSTRDGSPTGSIRSEWVYDTLPGGLGSLSESTRFQDGAEYTSKVLGYDEAGLPTGARAIIPEEETGLAGTYDTTFTYHQDGSPYTVTEPSAGGLDAEKLTYSYNDVGAPAWMVSAWSVYVADTYYSKLGDVTQRRLGNYGKRTVMSYVHDDATRRLESTSAMFEKQTGPTEVLDMEYSYDDAGNLVRIADSPGSATPNDTQCFRYDYLRRTTDAWTPLSTADDNCEASPGAQGGVARYRFAWQYDVTGNRVRQAQYSADGGYTDYEYPESGQDRPHALLGTVKNGPQGTETTSYSYDDAGHMTKRVVDGATQTIGWTIEGKVDEITGGPGSTEFVYDADGNRLIRRTPDGATLYLGSTELEYSSSDGQTSATRYYSHGGATVAVRTEDDVFWMVGDHHQTGTVAIRESDMSYQHRRTTPFGDARGSEPAWWPGDKGFVGGRQDPTGLTHLGARMYDSTLGRFISVDPLIDFADPQQMNGYAYSNNSPATFTDPDGLKFCESMNCDMPGEGYQDAAGNAFDRGGERLSGPRPPSRPSVKDTTKTVTGGVAALRTRLQWELARKKLFESLSELAYSASQCDLVCLPYSYSFQWPIGPVGEVGTPADVMDVFSENPQEVFPFDVTGCDEFGAESVCTLHPGPEWAGGVGDVSVRRKSTSVEFTVISEDYFDQPGNKIEFRTVEYEGWVMLQQHANADSGIFGWLGVQSGGVHRVWRKQANNLRELFGIDPMPPAPIHSPNRWGQW